ncbi:MAG: hypothetical protein PHD21_02205 [Flavobacteriales bacterium]|nr:hypothetical protein [Flavobacteriales bacterium]
MAQSLIYGGQGQYGAVIIKTKGMHTEQPVERTDFEVAKAKRISGAEGMKAFIETQGSGLVYDDGKINIDGKECELYIINDKEFSHMRGIEANMIDDIIIIRTGGVPAYGEKAKNGVILIYATQKEKKAVNEQGETVFGKEAKKVLRKIKSKNNNNRTKKGGIQRMPPFMYQENVICLTERQLRGL